MKRIELNDRLLDLLDDLKEDIALCDASGTVVATVQRSTPWADPETWEQLTPEISQEEWNRLSNSDERGISTSEMLRQVRENT